MAFQKINIDKFVFPDSICVPVVFDAIKIWRLLITMCQIYRKRVFLIQIWFRLTRFRKYFYVYTCIRLCYKNIQLYLFFFRIRKMCFFISMIIIELKNEAPAIRNPVYYHAIFFSNAYNWSAQGISRLTTSLM